MNALMWMAYIALCFLITRTTGGGSGNQAPPDNWHKYDYTGKSDLSEEDRKDMDELPKNEHDEYLDYTKYENRDKLMPYSTKVYFKYLNATLVKECVKNRDRYYYNPHTGACTKLYFGWYRHEYLTYGSYLECVKSRENRCSNNTHLWYYGKYFKKCLPMGTGHCAPGDPVYPTLKECESVNNEDVIKLFCYNHWTTKCQNTDSGLCTTNITYTSMYDCLLKSSNEPWSTVGSYRKNIVTGVQMDRRFVWRCKSYKLMVYYDPESTHCKALFDGGYQQGYKAYRSLLRCERGEGENRCSKKTDQYYYSYTMLTCRSMADGQCKPGDRVYPDYWKCKFDDGSIDNCGSHIYEAYKNMRTGYCQHMSDGDCQTGDRAFYTMNMCRAFYSTNLRSLLV